MKNKISNIKIETWLMICTSLISCVLLKLIYIFFMTKRGMSLQYPFDSYLFNPFDRYTDWIVPLEWAKTSNPWDMTSDLSKNIPPCPYGPLTFLYLRVTQYLGTVVPFFLMILIFCLKNIIELKKSLKFLNINIFILLALIILTGFYPLHFLVDRGNTAVIGYCLIAYILFNLNNYSYRDGANEIKPKYIFEILIILLVGTKPSWGLMLFPLLFLSVYSFFRAIFFIILIYLIPIIFFNISILDYISCAKQAYLIMKSAINFQHDILAGAQVVSVAFKTNFFDISNVQLYSLILGLTWYFFGLIYLKFIKSKNKSQKLFFAFSHTLLCILLFNRPSPDYNLVPILTIVIVLIDMLAEAQMLTNKDKIIIVTIFTFIGTWLNFFSKSEVSLIIPFRTFALMVFNMLIIFYFSKKVLKVKSNDV